MLINAVAPFAGAWIEMIPNHLNTVSGSVAPFAGAWIEIQTTSKHLYSFLVAPFAGAWIEIPKAVLAPTVSVSLPSRERGLK